MAAFSLPAVPALHGSPCPPDWRQWSVLRRVAWLHREGPAADPLEAADWLRQLGEWPSQGSPVGNTRPGCKKLSPGVRRDRLSKYY